MSLAVGAALLSGPPAAADDQQFVQLQPNRGYCFVRADMVGCLMYMTNREEHLAEVTPGGSFQWTGGTSLGGNPIDLTTGQPYHANGWTVLVGSADTTFTNDATGHGMTVTVSDATPF